MPRWFSWGACVRLRRQSASWAGPTHGCLVARRTLNGPAAQVRARVRQQDCVRHNAIDLNNDSGIRITCVGFESRSTTSGGEQREHDAGSMPWRAAPNLPITDATFNSDKGLVSGRTYPHPRAILLPTIRFCLFSFRMFRNRAIQRSWPGVFSSTTAMRSVPLTSLYS